MRSHSNIGTSRRALQHADASLRCGCLPRLVLSGSIASWLDPLVEMPEKEFKWCVRNPLEAPSARGGDGLECNPCRAYLKWNYRGDAKKPLVTEIRTQQEEEVIAQGEGHGQ